MFVYQRVDQVIMLHNRCLDRIIDISNASVIANVDKGDGI